MNLNAAAILKSFVVVFSLLIVSAVAEEKGVKSIAGLFAVIDPDKDCEFNLLGDNLAIMIPPAIHNLHPVRGMNAPRVLKKVSGNFTVHVKVTGDFKPGAKSATPLVPGAPFNGAGILIWDNDENYLRIERNAYWAGKNLMCYPPLIEYWHNRAYAGFNEDPAGAEFFKGESTWFKARRKGKEVTVSMSHNGTEWSEIKKVTVEMPDEVSVGVAALNSSNLPFTVEFDEFTIETD